MSNNTHSFAVSLATKIGFEEALLLQHFTYWFEQNIEDPNYIKKGLVWCYSSISKMGEIFPYMTTARIRRAIANLIQQGYIVSGDFNNNPLIKTKWYALTKEGAKLMGKEESFNSITNASSQNANAFAQIANHNNNKNNNTKKESIKERIQFAEFVSMTEEEHSKLVSDFGEDTTKEFIRILDNYKGSSGKKYKNDYRAILNWVVDRYKQERNRTYPPSTPAPKEGKKNWQLFGFNSEEEFKNAKI